MTDYRLYGTTDDVTTCEICGKPELKGTVMLQPLDADGNPEDLLYAGTTCAARLLNGRLAGRRVTGARIRQEAQAADMRRAEAVRMSRDMVAVYAPFEHDHDLLASEYTKRNRYYQNHPEADALARALESLTRHREIIATGGISAL